MDTFFPTQAVDTKYDLIVIGSGPAGSAAATYAARNKVKTLVLDKAPGSGALAITRKIANYPGVPEGVSGLTLLQRFWTQAQSFGAEFVETAVQGVDVTGNTKYVFTPEQTYEARSLVIAAGSRGRAKKLPGEESFAGRGVSYCGTCDAPFFQDKTVAVVGDNDEVIKETIALTRFARIVHVIIPNARLLGKGDLASLTQHGQVQIHLSTKPLEVKGDTNVTGIVTKEPGKNPEEIKVDGVFLFLSGSKPATDFLVDQLPLDEEGHPVVDPQMATSVPGVFAAGDVRKSSVKQVVMAASDGALAAIAADRYLNDRSRLAV